jgi:translation initiation factor 4E
MDKIDKVDKVDKIDKINKNENFDLKNKWILWFHKVNDNNWNIESYIKVFEIKTYYDILFIIKEIDNITSGMFFLMKENIIPIFEDEHNVNGGYWSLRITKKESIEYWERLIYYICIDSITTDEKYEEKINGISISPKINNCIFKIWNSDFKNMKTDYLRKDMESINLEETFYLEHSAD